MTFIGFLLGLAVGAGLMFYLVGSRVQQQGAQAQQGGRQGQRQNRQGMAARPGFNTEFGTMGDASTTPNGSVKPAALSATVFSNEGTGADLTEKGNKQSAGQLPTDSAALETGTVNQPETGGTTMMDQSAVASRIPEEGTAVNRTTNGGGNAKTRQKNAKNKR